MRRLSPNSNCPTYFSAKSNIFGHFVWLSRTTLESRYLFATRFVQVKGHFFVTQMFIALSEFLSIGISPLLAYRASANHRNM
jgi:hypothetical protein